MLCAMNDEHVMNGAARRRLPLCGARTRAGGACKRPAGSGTDHVGFGTCRHHAGSTPSGRQSAARQQALAELRAIGDVDEIDPVEALQAAVNLAYARLARLHSKVGPVADVALVRLEGEAVDRLVRTAKAATDSKVVERRTQLAERQGAAIAAAAERAIERMGGFSYEQRVAFAAYFSEELAPLEG
jgi:hypothetical protein